MAKINNHTTIVQSGGGEEVYYSEISGIMYTKNTEIPSNITPLSSEFQLIFQRCMNLESISVLATGYKTFSWYAFTKNPNLKRIYVPYCKKTTGAIASLYANQDAAPRTVQLGSIGYAVTEMNSNTFSSNGGTGSNWEAHIYVNADNYKTTSAYTNKPFGAPYLSTLIYKSAVDGSALETIHFPLT